MQAAAEGTPQALQIFAMHGIASKIQRNTKFRYCTSHRLQGLVRLSIRTLLIAACAILPMTLNAQQVTATTGTANDASAAKTPPKVLSAAVEEIVASEDGGYRASAYIFRWHGTRVLLTDPLGRSHLSVGDNLNFIASHHDVADKRILSFIITGGSTCKCDAKSQTPRPSIKVGFSDAKTSTGLVEEVLSTEDDGYRFVAYIVQAHDSRIAVSDPLGESHHVVGESIALLTTRTTVSGNRLMSFLVLPPSDKKLAKSQTAPITSEETGIIQEVLRTNLDGFGYTAYIIESLGSRVVVVSDVPGARPHQTGEQISFVAQRVRNPNSTGPGILRFAPSAPDADKQEDINLSMTNETATVEEVLTAQADGYRFVAYIVNWNGARVAVSDAFANTNYVVGDQISFPVSRASSPSGRQLGFLLFHFDGLVVPRQGNDAASAKGKTT